MLIKRSIDSTNEYLKRLLHQGYTDSLAVLASYQTSGKGHFGKVWHSDEAKNLLFSVRMPAVQNKFELPRDNFILQCNFLQIIHNFFSPLLGEGLKIKWPNDIYYGYDKIGGVLTELVRDTNRLPHFILGLGFNVNQSHFNQLQYTTSLMKVTGAETNIFPLAFTLESVVLEGLFNQQDSLKFYNEHLLFRGEWVYVYINQEQYRAKIERVDADGSMLLTIAGDRHKRLVHSYGIRWERIVN